MFQRPEPAAVLPAVIVVGLMPVRIVFMSLVVCVPAVAVSADEGRNLRVADPIMVEAERLADAGQFAEALRVLSRRDDSPGAEVARRRAEQAEILRRIRLDYDLTEGAMLERLRRAVPDVSAEDLRRWRESGEIQSRRIDEALWYFNREPSNLFKRSNEARERRDRADGGAEARADADRAARLVRHLAEIVAEANRGAAVEYRPVRHRVTFSITLTPRHHALKSGSRVRIWMPYAQEYRQQRDVRLVRASPAVTTVGPNWDEARGGQRQRSLYFETRVDDATRPVRVEAVYEWTCAAYYPRLDPVKARPHDTGSALYREFTAERPPHIVFTPEIRAIAERETAGLTNPLERARRLWLWITRNIRYAYEAEYSTIPSLAVKAIRAERGDCGVQGMAFLALCRAAGVPARWQSGWQTKPWGYTMHDWTEFHVEPWGWLPADPSYGLQASENPRIREFYFGHMDAYRCIMNLDYGCPLVPPKETFRSEPVDFQRGEVEVDGENWYYDEWSYAFRLEWPDEAAPDRESR